MPISFHFVRNKEHILIAKRYWTFKLSMHASMEWLRALWHKKKKEKKTESFGFEQHVLHCDLQHIRIIIIQQKTRTKDRMLFLPRNSVTTVHSVLLINNTAFLLPYTRIGARMYSVTMPMSVRSDSETHLLLLLFFELEHTKWKLNKTNSHWKWGRGIKFYDCFVWFHLIYYSIGCSAAKRIYYLWQADDCVWQWMRMRISSWWQASRMNDLLKQETTSDLRSFWKWLFSRATKMCYK